MRTMYKHLTDLENSWMEPFYEIEKRLLDIKEHKQQLTPPNLFSEEIWIACPVCKYIYAPWAQGYGRARCERCINQ